MCSKRRLLSKSRDMNSYIVRIYRRQEKSPGGLVGVVEDVEVEEKQAFKSVEELWKILASSGTGSKRQPGAQRSKPRARSREK